MPKVSVIVPVYGVEKYVSECIESILNQTYTDWELILVDDGSLDKSGEICDQYAAKDNRIKVFHKENGGVSSARNCGIKLANGEWIYFCDADDKVMPDAFNYLISQSKNTQTDLIIAGYQVFNANEELIYNIVENRKFCLDRDASLKMMFRPLYFKYQGYLWTKLFKKEIITKYNILFDEKFFFNEDRLFIVQYITHIKGYTIYSTYPIYKYYERSDSALASIKTRFNPKYLTDIDASVEILHNVQKTNNKKNLLLAQKAIKKSYLLIRSMMDRSKKGGKDDVNNLNQILKNNVSKSLYCLTRFEYAIKYLIKKTIGLI